MDSHYTEKLWAVCRCLSKKKMGDIRSRNVCSQAVNQGNKSFAQFTTVKWSITWCFRMLDFFHANSLYVAYHMLNMPTCTSRKQWKRTLTWHHKLVTPNGWAVQNYVLLSIVGGDGDIPCITLYTKKYGYSVKISSLLTNYIYINFFYIQNLRVNWCCLENRQRFCRYSKMQCQGLKTLNVERYLFMPKLCCNWAIVSILQTDKVLLTECHLSGSSSSSVLPRSPLLNLEMKWTWAFR